jgi:PTS system mannose-specific IIA component
MSNTSIILASHGYFAQEALKSVEMIIGYPQEDTHVVSVSAEKDYDTCLNELRNIYNNLNHDNGVLILTDIYGGTPSKIATHLALEYENILVYSGFNLPILLEIMFQRHLDLTELSQLIESVHGSSLINITNRIKEINNGNQVDSY